MGFKEMTDKKLSIIILCFNKWNFTKTCLNDLSKLPNDHEIIVVDNGSTDETYANLKDSTEIKYLRNEQNVGFAKGNNFAYCFTTAPNVMFLNNDIKVRSDYSTWTQNLIDKCDNAIVGPTMGQLDDQLNFVKEDNKLLTGKSYMSGWCLVSSKKIWSQLDLSGNNQIFDERFFCYFEDTDLSFRAREIGIPFEVVDIPVVHFGKTSSKQLNVPILYQNARNIFIEKWRKRIKK